MRGQERGGDGGGGEPEERGKEEREVERSGAREDVCARNVRARTYPASWGCSSPLKVRVGRSSGGPETNFPIVKFLILQEAETRRDGGGKRQARSRDPAQLPTRASLLATFVPLSPPAPRFTDRRINRDLSFPNR